MHDVTEAFTQPVAARLLFTIVNRTRKHVPASERAGKEKKPTDDKKCGCGGRYGAKEGRTAGAGAVVKDSTVSGRAASAAVISKAHDAAATTAPMTPSTWFYKGMQYEDVIKNNFNSNLNATTGSKFQKHGRHEFFCSLRRDSTTN